MVCSTLNTHWFIHWVDLHLSPWGAKTMDWVRYTKNPTNKPPPNHKKTEQGRIGRGLWFSLCFSCDLSQSSASSRAGLSAFPAVWRRARRAGRSHMRTLGYPHPAELKSSSFWREGRETPRSSACSPPPSPAQRFWPEPSLGFPSERRYPQHWLLKNGCLYPREVQLSGLLGLLTRQKMPVEWAMSCPHLFLKNYYFFKV